MNKILDGRKHLGGFDSGLKATQTPGQVSVPELTYLKGIGTYSPILLQSNEIMMFLFKMSP